MDDVEQLHIRIDTLADGRGYYGAVLEYPTLEIYAKTKAEVRHHLRKAATTYLEQMKTAPLAFQYEISPL